MDDLFSFEHEACIKKIVELEGKLDYHEAKEDSFKEERRRLLYFGDSLRYRRKMLATERDEFEEHKKIELTKIETLKSVANESIKDIETIKCRMLTEADMQCAKKLTVAQKECDEKIAMIQEELKQAAKHKENAIHLEVSANMKLERVKELCVASAIEKLKNMKTDLTLDGRLSFILPIEEECSVCASEKRSNMVFYPCGHGGLCDGCIAQINHGEHPNTGLCPLCRGKIDDVITVRYM